MNVFSLAAAVERRLDAITHTKLMSRIWARDRFVWTDDPNAREIVDRLGWLDLPTSMAPKVPELQELASDVGARFDRVVLLGMGGSSLAPEVLWRTIGGTPDSPRFHMLDSTHPAAVTAIGDDADLERTLFVVASKSGSTVETTAFFHYFWERTGKSGAQFIAITDGGSGLETLARDAGFRNVFLNPADVGGRFSALSLFGLVPAALVGIDAEALRVRGAEMADRCAEGVPAHENPGAVLGAWLGEGAVMGRDKVAIDASDGVESFGLWADQLIAESTGKRGLGILPVTGRGVPPSLPSDHLKVIVRMGDAAGTASEHEAPPIELRDGYDLAAEFFRWEMATAVAGAILRVNPFDQPNVGESKGNTARVLERGSLEPPRPVRRNAIQSFIDGVKPGDYVAIGAWLPPTPRNDERLTTLQRELSERLGVAVTVAYGPRFLHSTGQLHKGGPARGHFVQILDPEPPEVPVPELSYTFGDLIGAQALGDAQALEARGRPVLRIVDFDRFLETV